MTCKVVGSIFGCVSVLIAGVSGGQAADIYQSRDYGDYKDAPGIIDHVNPWQGFYIGANLGYAWQHDSTNFTLRDDSNVTNTLSSVTPFGPVGGGQIGYNFQRNQYVFGIEADLDAFDTTDKSRGFAAFGNPYVLHSSLEWASTARGRIGYSIDRSLVYITGGVAAGGITDRVSLTNLGTNTVFNGKRETTQIGYTIGGGAEIALNSSWAVKFEYQYIDLGSQNVQGAFGATNVSTSDLDHGYHTLKIGLNYFITHNRDPLN